MAEYIEREALLERLEYSPLFSNIRDGGFFIKDGVLDLVERQPIADVVEVRHGEWVYHSTDENDTIIFRCSECGRKQYGNSHYCPNCGADMRGDKNG